DIEWENGQVKTFRVKSLLGGNLRVRAACPLTLNGPGELSPAGGANPNPFFRTPEIPAPLISEEARLNPPAVKPVFEYDVPTVVGKEYVFVPQK
ncbi:MAG: glycoside hydrolase family 95 protein, partial [Tannerella sp.]|nr:glycoside hydrolase family 95 protein [Tannerella sp.]